MKNRLPISGWLVIDKPLGLTSTQVVGRVRYLTRAAKAGHGGTLDPLASGVLPIALGEATKTVAYAMDGRKTYRFTVRWGTTTTTGDTEGEAVARSKIRPGEISIAAILPRFSGVIEQMPPAFSALKIEGRRAYDLARTGEAVTLRSRPVTIYSLKLIDCPDADHAIFETEVGKGFYIRSLAVDLAQALGTKGHVAQLARLSVGRFSLADAISLEELEEAVHKAALDTHLLPIETALDDIPALALTETEASKLKQGQCLSWFSKADHDRLMVLGPGCTGVALATAGSRPIAIVEVANAEIRSLRVINL